MKQFLLICMAFAISAQAFAQSPELMRGEILRRGDMVEHITDGLYTNSVVGSYEEAMRPPASDADKWFISVLTTSTCPGCEQLRRDWGNSPHLLALGHPDPNKSWSHFNWYKFEDGSQNWRFGELKITRVPTIIVQPPRSGRYGDPKIVIFQGYYEGNPELLASQITGAIKQYIAKVNALQQELEQQVPQDQNICPGPNCPSPYQPNPQPNPNVRPLTPPWQPGPSDDRDLLDLFPKNNPVDIDLTIPPSGFGGGSWKTLFWGIAIGAGLVVAGHFIGKQVWQKMQPDPRIAELLKKLNEK